MVSDDVRDELMQGTAIQLVERRGMDLQSKLVQFRGQFIGTAHATDWR